MQDPTVTIYRLLKDNWSNENTSMGYDPQIHTGWWDTENNQPEVTISNRDETAVRGGRSPFTGIDPSGAGPTQTINGEVQVNCWSSREVEANVNPKKLVHEFSEEVKRIVKANTTLATDLRFIGYNGGRLIVDQEAEPAVFRIQMIIWYVYEERP